MRITSEESARGELTDENLVAALRSLREAGYVVLENALDVTLVERLRAAFHDELMRAAESRGEDVKKSGGHYGVNALPREPFTNPNVIENPFAFQVMRAAMGQRVFSYFPYGSNVTWPGSTTQHLHRDTGHLFPELNVALPISIAVVNIPLVDFTIENGCTEVWPGSHLIVDRPVDAGLRLEDRAESMPSVRLTVPVGSLVVRDLRCWHRGMPNRTESVRAMTAQVVFRQFHALPDDPNVFRPLPDELREGLSESLRSVYRHHRTESGESG